MLTMHRMVLHRSKSTIIKQVFKQVPDPVDSSKTACKPKCFCQKCSKCHYYGHLVSQCMQSLTVDGVSIDQDLAIAAGLLKSNNHITVSDIDCTLCASDDDATINISTDIFQVNSSEFIALADIPITVDIDYEKVTMTVTTLQHSLLMIESMSQ